MLLRFGQSSPNVGLHEITELKFLETCCQRPSSIRKQEFHLRRWALVRPLNYKFGFAWLLIVDRLQSEEQRTSFDSQLES